MQHPPNQYGPYGYGQPPMPQQPPKALPHKRLWRWFRSRKMWLQVLIACLIFSCSLCTCVTSIVASSTPKTNIAQSQVAATPTDTPVPTTDNTNALDATATATDTPTPTPTDTPTPTPTQKPTPKPTQPPVKPTPTPAPKCQAVNGNPWCYNFSPGSLITNPPSAFCSYFACIANFWNGHGYVNECNDGEYSKSGGISGDCSHHGGMLQPLYSH